MQDNSKGICLMVFAMFCFAISDSVVKVMLEQTSPAQVALMVSSGLTLVLALMAISSGQPLFSAVFFHPAVLGRSIAEAITSITIITAIAFMPLSTLSALIQANPLFAILGAAVLFRNPIGWRQWTAILMGFTGVLLVMRSNSEEFSISSQLALLVALSIAARDLLARAAPPEIPALTMRVWGFALVPFTALLILSINETELTPVSLSCFWLSICSIVFVLMGYDALARSRQIGDLSVIGPFRYTCLFFMTMSGMIFFDEYPGVWSIPGALFIICAGTYCFSLAHTERGLHRSKEK